MRSKVSQNKTEQIKCNDINKKHYSFTKKFSSSETVVVPIKWLPSND